MTADPIEIPSGVAETTLFVELFNPTPGNGLDIFTELTADSGTITDPFARETAYACAHDVSGPVEICAHATYTAPNGDAGTPDAGTPDAGTPDSGTADGGSVAASYQYLGKPHVRLSDPLECSDTRCTTVICPEDKNECPVVSSLTVDPSPPTLVPEGGTATITVVAEDPDDNPESFVTTLSALHGTVADPSASETTYTCDPDVGGIIQICVVASDGDASCDVEQCATVRCPGEPLENTCPVIGSLTADPNPILTGEDAATIRVDATDPDEFPEPLRTEFSSEGGGFQDLFARETTFRCGEPGPVEVLVTATDGDPACDQTRSLTVQCPAGIRPNICPMLFVINAVPSVISPGDTTTIIQTRGQDTDAKPIPLVLTLRARWGSFLDVENIPGPNNLVTQDAFYVCDRPGQVEICVDATDGACNKTQCSIVTCPDDIVPPP